MVINDVQGLLSPSAIESFGIDLKNETVSCLSVSDMVNDKMFVSSLYTLSTLTLMMVSRNFNNLKCHEPTYIGCALIVYIFASSVQGFVLLSVTSLLFCHVFAIKDIFYCFVSYCTEVSEHLCKCSFIICSCL